MLRLCLTIFLFACVPPTAASQKTLVFVSIPPQKFLVEKIGGALVDVRVMIQPGETPETFDPSQRQIRALHDAQLYFQIGVPFEEKWLEGFANTRHGPRLVDCCRQLIDDATDHHSWTSARNLQLMAVQIREELTAQLPQHTQQIEQNFLALIVELEQLDAEIYGLLEHRRSDYFFISHAALGHFADDYGLKQVALETEGRQLGARSLVRILRKAEEENISTLFVQTQHPSTSAKAFARELDARVIEIDPLAADYLANLRRIAAQIAGSVY